MKAEATVELIDKRQMATRMGVTPRTIDSWMAKGFLQYRKIGRLVRFDWLEVCECLKLRNRPAVAKPVRQAGEGIAGLLRQRAAEIRKGEVTKPEGATP